MPFPFVAAATAALPFIAKGAEKLFAGSGEKHKQVPRLLKNQIPIQQQLANAAQNEGAGGAFGQSADYYRNLLSDNPADFQAMAAPEMRNFRENIIPGINEQFAGMGAGGLSSSGFQNAAVGAGTDLAERLAYIRANLRMQGAQGLQNIGAQSLGNFSNDVTTQQGTQGLLPAISQGVGNAATQFAGDWLKNKFGGNSVGQNSSPYGSGKSNTLNQLDMGFRSGAIR